MADGRQRLKWIREHQPQKFETKTTSEQESTESVNIAVQKQEPQDSWSLGPGNQVRRIHVVPRSRRFVPIVPSVFDSMSGDSSKWWDCRKRFLDGNTWICTISVSVGWWGHFLSECVRNVPSF